MKRCDAVLLWLAAFVMLVIVFFALARAGAAQEEKQTVEKTCGFDKPPCAQIPGAELRRGFLVALLSHRGLGGVRSSSRTWACNSILM